MTSAAEILPRLEGLTDLQCAELIYDWEGQWCRDSQQVPPGDWFIWLVLTGRGFGKTRMGAEWTIWGAANGFVRQALVAGTQDDVRDIMIEGESGILACSPPWFYPLWEPARKQLTWPNGAIAKCYSAEGPQHLRGPQHDRAWVEELASWRNTRKRTKAWDNLMLGLRLGRDPRCIVTTTPKPIKLIRDLVDDPDCVVTGGTTYENLANLTPVFKKRVIAKYEGTTKGEEELLGRLLKEDPSALWKRDDIDNERVRVAPDLINTAVAIDPATTANKDSDECGIMWGGRDERSPPHYYLCGDLSEKISPDAWAKRAVDAYTSGDLDKIIYESNQGGDLVKLALRTAYPDIGNDLPIEGVHASRGKRTRAEPIAMLYEQRRVHHVGSFPDLEDELCNWVPGDNESPNRLDALVWLIAHLSGSTEISASPVDTSSPSRYGGM